jgi:spore coat polysaccharide biosynthesis protein SpsF
MKVLGIIQARMGSTRLPGKVMYKLNEKTILETIVLMLKNSKFLDKIIVATTNLKEDDTIIDLCKKIGIESFRGSSKNVLERYYECAKKFDGDIIVRITGDSPLIDYMLTDKAIKSCIDNNYDYVSNVLHLTYPLGYNSCEVFPFRILKKLYFSNNDSMSKEHVTYHIRKYPESYNIGELSAPELLQRSNWRLTIDYAEDYSLMEKLFSLFFKDNYVINYEYLVKFLETNSDILETNKKYWVDTKFKKYNPIKDGLIK